VGRAPELALLERFLGDAAAEAPRVLLLAGEPGIGKTRLLQALAQRAVPHGWGVLVGGCQRRGEQEPYAPLLDALARHLQTQQPAQRRANLQGCAWLVRLLPEWAELLEPLPPGTWPPAQERRLLYAAVGRLLANMAGPAGTLLVLDDLQWAGPDALDLLATLAHTAAGVRVVGAYRDSEVRPADPLGLLLADLAQARLVRQHPLAPLAAEAAADLLHDLLAGVAGAERAAQEAALQRAGGMPFFLVSYAQALQQGSAEGVPWDLAQGVRQRVALLSAAGQAVLGVAAIVGRRVPHALLRAVAGQPEDAVLEGLEAACGARLLLEDGEEAYVFAHDLIREVVEDDLGAARRAVLHRRVAEALEGGPAGAAPALLAYHYGRGGAADKAVRYLEKAGDQAWSQRAHGAAEGHYRELVGRLESAGRAHEAVRVREKLGEVLYRAARFEAVIEVLEPAARTLHVAGEWEDLARVVTRIGRAYACQGRSREGLARLRPVLAVLEQAGAPMPLATLHEAVGQLLLAAGLYEESLAAHERMADLALNVGDDRLRALAEGHCVNLLQMLGRIGEALRRGQEALAVAEVVGDLDILRRAHVDLGYLHGLRGALSAGRRHLARALELADQLRAPGEVALALALGGWLAVLGGDWAEAQADLDRALPLSRQAEGLFLTYCQIVGATLALAEGDRAASLTAVGEALARAETTEDLQTMRWAARIMAELEVQEGCPQAAVVRLEPLLDRPGRAEYDATALLPVLAWAYLEEGRLGEAIATVEQALDRTRREGMRLVLVEALRVQALVEVRQSRWAEAEQALVEGLTLARAMPQPHAEARLLSLEGEMHAQKGEAGRARERLDEALAIFQRLGARTDVERTEQALSALLPDRSSCEMPGTG
jgi:tetratricopeptide (TPR) repeat protein